MKDRKRTNNIEKERNKIMKKGILVIFAALIVAFLAFLMLPLLYADNGYDYVRNDCVCDHNAYGEGSQYDQYTATGLSGYGYSDDSTRWYYGEWWFQRGYNEDCEWGAHTGPFCYWKIGSNNYNYYGGGSWYLDGGYWKQDHFENHDVSSNYIAGKTTSYFRVPFSNPPSYWLIGYQWAELWR
jgi:hypothetical protein